ncbi:hypothetical protein SVIOM74S_03648 [Streptomyces violarus]
MRRDVARAVRHGRRLAALPETGQRPERRPGVRRVRVVHGDGEPPVERGDRRGPGLVPGQADLGPQPRLAGQRPPPRQPPRLLPVDRLPEPLGPVLPDQHPPRHARGVHLRDLHRYVVQPLVGEQQPGDALRRLGRPLDPVIEPLGPLGDFDGVRARAGRHVGRERGEHPAGQLAAPGRHVDEVQRRGPPQRLVDPAQQPRHGPCEQRRRVHGRTEVPGRPLGPAIEAARPVQGLPSRRTPPSPLVSLVSLAPRHCCHGARLSGHNERNSTLRSTRARCGSVLRLTPAPIPLPYAGLRAAPL